KCLCGSFAKSILQVPQEGLSIDLGSLIEGESDVLRERALARSIEAGDPNPDLMPAPALHRGLHILQQALELGFDAIRDDVLANLRLQAVLLRRLVRDHLLDGPVDALSGVEQRANLSHIREPGCVLICRSSDY